MAATKMFLIKWYSSSTNLKVFQIWKTSGTTYLLVVWKSSGSRLDFLEEVVWTSRKSSGLHGSLLTKSPFHNRSERFGFSDLEDFWDDLPVSLLEVVWTSWKSSDKVVWTSWKSSGLPVKSSGLPVKSSGSRLNFLKLSGLVYSSGIQACLCRGVIYNCFTTYNSVVHETTEIRLKCKSSGKVKLLKLSSQIRLNFQSSQVTDFKVNCKNNLCVDQTTSSSLAYIRLLQAHRITNESNRPRIVSFYDSMNHKKFRIKILGFFSSLWRGKSILGALRASNWLFMVVVILMTMAILSCFNGTSMRWYELSHHPTRSNPRSSPSSEFSTVATPTSAGIQVANIHDVNDSLPSQENHRSYKQVIEASRSFHGFDLDPAITNSEWSKPELDGPQISQAAADAFVRYKIGVKQGVR
ncbi:hypothetical protein IGI04_022996 [Brassica rapa subsp. trilocularis]|uniref:Uncharacterized protein n=1 Tax=Brassica rapa subsp. trilocularis TaxID=1813537 RepID=A0ABQ7M2I8_BRACM|nr:hypothetical protein IGI04_022996 [Brassica rapa subsp. trilocularis]